MTERLVGQSLLVGSSGIASYILRNEATKWPIFNATLGSLAFVRAADEGSGRSRQILLRRSKPLS